MTSHVHPQVRESVARVMVGAIADYSEQRYAAGWYTGIETILWRATDEQLAAGLRQLAITYDVWPMFADWDDPAEPRLPGAVVFDRFQYRLLTLIEAVRELGAPGASVGEALPHA